MTDWNALVSAPGFTDGLQHAGGAAMQAIKAPPNVNAQIAKQGGDAANNVGQIADLNNMPAPTLQDPAHPVWGVMNNLTGNPGNAPLPGGGGPAAGAIPAPPQGAAPMGAQPVAGMQNGGVVKLNHGSPVIQPEFTRGPALPTGPNSGIVPASTQGQILTMDAGGVVPDGYIPQASGVNSRMSGGGAGFVQGLMAGQTIGHNLRQAWLEHESRSSAAKYADAATGVDVNNPASGEETPHPQGVLGKAKDAVEGFFKHMHEVSLDDNHSPNGTAAAAPVPTAGDSGAGGSTEGAIPAPATASPDGVGAAPPAVPAVPATGDAGAPAAPVGAAAPAGPAVGAPPVGGPSAGATPPAGQPGGQPAVPVTAQQQATSDAAKLTAADPEVRQGIPQKTPAQSGLPHSMTPDHWAKLNELRRKAVVAAAAAGEDPGKVYESLTAMQNAHFQGQMLKQLGTANVALQNGDMKSVKQSLMNLNYYLPDGQDIKFRQASPADVQADQTGQTKPGDLMYRNPFFGMYGHQNEPEFTSVTAQHLQMLGAAALNPQTIQDTMLKSYSAQMEARNKAATAAAEGATGEGRRLIGAAAYQRANNETQLLDVTRRLKIAQGDLAEANAGKADRWVPTTKNSGQPKITMASMRNAQTDAANYVDHAIQGQMTTAPIMDADGNPSLSPAAGKSIHDPSRVPTIFQGLTADQQEGVKNIASQVNAANLGMPGMNPAKAADLAARVIRYQTKPTTHLNPQTHKAEKDFVYDPENGTAHVWVGNNYENVYLKPNVADEGIPPPEGSSYSGSSDSDSGSDAAPSELPF